eukprot:3770585-Rhodomonas_salina.2
MVLRACYAVSGTELSYGATQDIRVWLFVVTFTALVSWTLLQVRKQIQETAISVHVVPGMWFLVFGFGVDALATQCPVVVAVLLDNFMQVTAVTNLVQTQPYSPKRELCPSTRTRTMPGTKGELCCLIFTTGLMVLRSFPVLAPREHRLKRFR